MPPERAPSSRRLLTLLRVLLALAILVWVGTNLPWRDELTYRAEPDAAEVEADGRIEGDWKTERVSFVPDDRSKIGEGWPAEAREAVARGEPVVVERRAEDGKAVGFDWHPGMPRAFRDMDLELLLVAEALFLLSTLTIVTRWWRLLALAGCPTSWWNALRLTFLGLFFNNVLPGATGGDVVKGVVVARENPGRGAEALVTVLVDRVFGMVALAVLALVVILVAPQLRGGAKEAGASFDALRQPLIWGLVACAAGAALYSSKTFRRRAGLSALVTRLPIGDKLRSLDRAAMVYLKQPRAVAVAFLFSFVNHGLVTIGVIMLGLALGVPFSEVSLTEWFVLVPVANLVSAVPLAPGGWGLGELAFAGLFKMIDASGAMGVAVSVTFRLSQLAIGLLGGLAMLLPSSRRELREKN